jgi:hypothetical protein
MPINAKKVTAPKLNVPPEQDYDMMFLGHSYNDFEIFFLLLSYPYHEPFQIAIPCDNFVQKILLPM